MREEFNALPDAASLDKAKAARLNRQFVRQCHLITNNDRLDKVADGLGNDVLDGGVMMVIMIATTPSVDASSRPDVMIALRIGPDGRSTAQAWRTPHAMQ